MTLFLYSTSPTPHEGTILAACRPGPIQAVALLTALASPDPGLLDGLREHFPVSLTDSGLASREDAHAADVVARLAAADLVLIGGGSPERLASVTRDTPALAAMRQAYEAGTVIAACSAGAIVLGAGMISHGKRLDLWAWLPETVVAPHFGRYDITLWREAYPSCTVLGIPDDAMARVDGTELTSLGPTDLVTLPPWEATHAE